MRDHLRIAIMLDRFPVVSETFVLNQLTSLLELGHEIHVYARWRPDPGIPVHPDVTAYGLLERTTYVDELLPVVSGYWELPAHPAEGQTWIPGEAEPVENRDRLAAAAPVVERLREQAPEALTEVLDPREYGYQAESLSALYRLETLAALGREHDVVHAHFGPPANTFRFARLLWDAPLVVSLHGGFDLGSIARSSGPRVYERLFRCADAVTVNSRYSAAGARDLGCPDRLLHLLPEGLSVGRMPAPASHVRRDGALRVLTVARLVPMKGVRFLIEAVGLMASRRPVELDVVGDGPLREELEHLAARQASAIRFHGAQDANAVRALFGASDVFVLPSVHADGDEEAQGLVLQEAQASGLPVVSTTTGGIAEGVLDGRSGLLVPPEDPGALAAALLRLADDPGLRADMGRVGRSFVAEHFDQLRLTRQLVQLYRDVIAARSGVAT